MKHRWILPAALVSLITAAAVIACSVMFTSPVLALVSIPFIVPGAIAVWGAKDTIRSYNGIIAVLKELNPDSSESPQNVLRAFLHERERINSVIGKGRAETGAGESEQTLALKGVVHTSAHLIGMLRSIQDDTAKLTANVVESSSASIQIAETADKFSQSVETQSSAITETSASLEESTASIQNIKRTTGQSKEKSEVLFSLTKTSEELIQDTNKTIKEIVEKVSSIDAAIKIINNISSQTNLLAMNAAIEAAHAGAAGRGFAVVADEIRKLAESSSQNSKSISQSLKSIVKDVDVVQSSGIKSYENFAMVSSEVGDLIHSLSEIDDATEEILRGSEEILKAVTDLTSVSSDIENGSRELSGSIDDVTNAITDIQQIAQRTSHRLDEAGSVTGDMNDYIRIFLDAHSVHIGKLNSILNLVLSLPDESVSIPLMIQKHLSWVIKVRLALDKRLEIDTAEIGDHTVCELGKALASAESTGWSKVSFLGELESEHKKIHDKIQNIIRNIDVADKGKLEDEFDSLIEISEEIIGLLIKLNEPVSAEELH